MTTSTNNYLGAIEFKLQKNRRDKYMLIPRYTIFLFSGLLFLCVHKQKIISSKIK